MARKPTQRLFDFTARPAEPEPPAPQEAPSEPQPPPSDPPKLFADRVKRPAPGLSHAARVRQKTIFDILAGPAEASTGTVISPPAPARGNGDPTPLPPCPDAALPAGADSDSCREAPMTGSENS